MLAMGIFDSATAGLWGYTFLGVGVAVRNISLTQVSLYGILQVRRYGWRAIAMVCLWDFGGELTYNGLYFLSCPSSLLPVGVPLRPIALAVFAVGLPISLLIARPKFRWRSWPTLAFVVFNAVWLVAGMPVVRPWACLAATAPTPYWLGYPFEGVGSLVDFAFFYLSFSPRKQK